MTTRRERTLEFDPESRRRSCHDRARWALLMLFAALFLVAFRPDAMAWDGVFYYAYARSVALDGDLEFSNDIVLSYETTPGLDFVAQRFHRAKTVTGRTANPFAPGTGILWLPPYAIVAALVRLSGVMQGFGAPLTGYEALLRWSIAALSALCGLGAVLVGHNLAARMVGPRRALLASGTAMVSTPLIYYQFREPFYAHTASALLVAGAVSLWWRAVETERNSAKSAVALGAVTGAAALVRTQNLNYLILPTITALLRASDAIRRRQWRDSGRAASWLAAVCGTAAVVSSIQLSSWRLLYGAWVAIPQGQGFMNWRAPWIGPVLLSSYKGLVPWMPIIIPAVVGLMVLAWRRPDLGLPLVAGLGSQVYVNASITDWFGGGGYGPRRFAGTLVILVLGYAVLLDVGQGAFKWIGAVATSIGLAIHQWLLLSRGFADGIGGHLIRMTAPPAWAESGIAAFLRHLAGYLPDMLGEPVRSLVLSDSPLAIARSRPAAAAVQFALLLLTLAIAYAGTLPLLRFSSPPGVATSKRTFLWLSPALLVGAVLVIDTWILCCA